MTFEKKLLLSLNITSLSWSMQQGGQQQKLNKSEFQFKSVWHFIHSSDQCQAICSSNDLNFFIYIYNLYISTHMHNTYEDDKTYFDISLHCSNHTHINMFA